MAISKLAALNPNTSRILHYAEALSRTQFNVLIRELSGDLRKSQPSASNAAAKVDKFIPQLFRLKVAGITFGALANDPVWAEGLQLGAQAALQREPDNKFDRRAVAVLIEGRRVGYVAREDQDAVDSAVDAEWRLAEYATYRPGPSWGRKSRVDDTDQSKGKSLSSLLVEAGLEEHILDLTVPIVMEGKSPPSDEILSTLGIETKIRRRRVQAAVAPYFFNARRDGADRNERRNEQLVPFARLCHAKYWHNSVMT